MVRFLRPRPLVVARRAPAGRRSGRGPADRRAVGVRTAVGCALVLSLSSCGGGAGGESVGQTDAAPQLGGAAPGGDVPSAGTASSLAALPTASTGAGIPVVSTASSRPAASSAPGAYVVDPETPPREAVVALTRVVATGLHAFDAVGPAAGALLARLAPRLAQRVNEAAGASRAPVDGASTVLRAMLGVDGTAARIVRDANALVIDPDDAALCVARGHVPGEPAFEACVALAGRVEVRLTPSDASRGHAALRFDGRGVLQIVYGPGSGVVDLDLEGFAHFVRAGSELIEDARGARQEMSGLLRLALEATADGAGGERAKLALEMVEPVSVVGVDGTRLAVAEGSSLELVADVARATLSASVDVGETSYDTPDATDGGLRTYRVPPVAGAVTVDVDGETLLLSYTGSRLDPATFSVGGLELARFELDAFAFRFDGRADRVDVIEGGVEAAARVEDLLSGAGASLSATLSVPDRTTLRRHGEGRRRVDGGSVALSVSRLGGPVAPVEDYSLVATAGTCIESGSARSSWLPGAVSCEP